MSMIVADVTLVPASPYRASVPRSFARPTHRTYVRRRAAAAGLLLALLVVPAFALGSFVTGRGGDPASAAAARPANAAPATYVVQPGDSLWTIAAEFRGQVGQADYVERLIAANGGEAGVLAGQRLILP